MESDRSYSRLLLTKYFYGVPVQWKDEETGYIESGWAIMDFSKNIVPLSEVQEFMEMALPFYKAVSQDEIDRFNEPERTKKHTAQAQIDRASPLPTKARQKRPGHVYLLKAIGYSLFKIGMTSRTPDERLLEFAPKLPFETELVVAIETDDICTLEERLHEKYGDKRTNGEWFKLDSEDVKYIKELSNEFNHKGVNHAKQQNN